jgi:hypothetical protein
MEILKDDSFEVELVCSFFFFFFLRDLLFAGSRSWMGDYLRQLKLT